MDIVLFDPNALSQPISPQVQILDPVLNGEPRIVKRGSDISSEVCKFRRLIGQSKFNGSLTRYSYSVFQR